MSKKYKVVKVLVERYNGGLKVGDIVTLIERAKDGTSLVRLPKKLHGKGHNALRYKANNYWWFENRQIEPIKEKDND